MATLETSPPEIHPSEEALERFARGELSRREVREIVRHLLGNCTRCRRVTARLWGAGAPDPHWADKYRRARP